MKQKRFARIAMGWKRILPQKRPAAGREAFFVRISRNGKESEKRER
jgi:hypothetical protein